VGQGSALFSILSALALIFHIFENRMKNILSSISVFY